MLKLVSPRPPAPTGEPRRRGSAQDEVRMLHQQIEEERAAGQSTQRAVARGRHTIVEVQCCGQRASRSALSDTSPRTDDVRLLAELASRVEEIHQQLLLLSTGVEVEMDRLDLISAEIEQLSADGQASSTR